VRNVESGRESLMRLNKTMRLNMNQIIERFTSGLPGGGAELSTEGREGTPCVPLHLHPSDLLKAQPNRIKANKGKSR